MRLGSLKNTLTDIGVFLFGFLSATQNQKEKICLSPFLSYNKHMKKLAVIFIFVAVLISADAGYQYYTHNKTENGETKTGETGKSNLIIIDLPRAGDEISSPLFVSGKARGNWFFEASFPLILKDEKGNVIAGSHAQAQSDWMTEDFVAFTGVLTFKRPENDKNGILIFKKDNPTGLPEYDDALELPVVFK